MERIKRLSLLLFLWVPLLASAAPADLFTAVVPVADDSPEARRHAMAEALRQVLVKASGRRLEGKGEALEAVLQEAQNHAQEFRYRELPDADGAVKRALWVRFDRRQVARLLDRLGLLLWENGRPELVPWIALERKGRRRLADPEQDPELFAALRRAADRRGVRWVFPLLDLEDREAVTAADLWLGDRESLERASARYGRALPLAVRVERGRRGWRVHWRLILPDGEQDFESAAADLEEAFRQGLDQVADALARRYLPVPAQAGRSTLVLRFVGLHGPADYAFVRRLLNELELVTEVELTAAEGDGLEFRVQAVGGAEALRRRLDLVPELVPVPGTADDTASTWAFR